MKNIMEKNSIRKTILTILIFVLFFNVSTTRFTHAQAQNPMTVPIGTGFDFQSIMNYVKTFTLDKIAYMVAKQVLHQMTVSVVNWINTGFKGNPSFLSNPEGFFLDVGDQLTGEFLANSGPLARLCSPINLDLRLQLALNQSEFVDKRYSCTLSTVINNVQNARIQTGIDISSKYGGATIGDMISGDILKNPDQLSLGTGGASLDAESRFIKGSFDVGGWAGFMALTLEPQNNYYGAYMLAQDDLQARIAQKQAAINADLNRGNGFLSWQKCQDVTSQFQNSDGNDMTGRGGGSSGLMYGMDSNQLNQLNSNGSQTIKIAPGSSIQKKVDPKTKKTTYEDCKTETPGSVISGTLQKQLNVPATELELADNINAVVNALMSQMISQMLGGGLRSLSPGASGGTNSFTNQVIREELINPALTAQQIDHLNQDLGTATKYANQYKSIYDQALGLMVDTKNRFETARSCFSSIANAPNYTSYKRTIAQNQLANIDGRINNVINPLISDISIKQAGANEEISKLNKIDTTFSSVKTSSAQTYTEVSEVITKSTIDTNNSLDSAQKELEETKKTASDLNNEATKLQNDCSSLNLSSY